MAQIFGEKSRYLILMDYLHRIAAVLLYLTLLYSLYSYLKFSFTSPTSLFGLLLMSLLYFGILKWIEKDLMNYLQTAFNYKTGRQAEYKIVEELKTGLPDDFLVFQDIKLSKNKGNIDLVVIGRTGIFVLEVKSHKGNITLKNNELLHNGYGFRKNFLNQAMGNALELNKYLISTTGKDFFVNPVLVFENKSAFMRFGFNKVKNVSVIQKEFLIKLILRGDYNLPQKDLAKLKDNLNRKIN